MSLFRKLEKERGESDMHRVVVKNAVIEQDAESVIIRDYFYEFPDIPSTCWMRRRHWIAGVLGIQIPQPVLQSEQRRVTRLFPIHFFKFTYTRHADSARPEEYSEKDVRRAQDSKKYAKTNRPKIPMGGKFRGR